VEQIVRVISMKFKRGEAVFAGINAFVRETLKASVIVHSIRDQHERDIKVFSNERSRSDPI